MLDSKWSWRNEGFEGKKCRARPKLPHKLKQLKKARYKKRRLNQKSLTLVGKPSAERVMKSRLICLKLEAPEMVKKPLLSLPSNAQLFSNL